MHQVQLVIFILVMQEQHYSITCMLNITTEILVIRIEDTDKKRNLEDGETSQFDNLKWLGLDWDESVDKDNGYGPYRQSERQHIYQPLIDQFSRR